LISYISPRNKFGHDNLDAKTGTISTAFSRRALRFRIHFFFILEATIKMVGQSNKRKMQQHEINVFQKFD